VQLRDWWRNYSLSRYAVQCPAGVVCHGRGDAAVAAAAKSGKFPVSGPDEKVGLLRKINRVFQRRAIISAASSENGFEEVRPWR